MTNAAETINIALIETAATLRPVHKETVEVIKKSIERQGQLSPVIVYRDDDGTKTLLAGHHRYAALKKLGRTEILAVAFSDRLDAQIAALTDNLDRKGLQGAEKYQFIRQLCEALGERDCPDIVSYLSDTRKAGPQHAKRATALAAEMTGLSKRTIQRALKATAPATDPESEAPSPASEPATAQDTDKKLKAAVGRLLKKFDPEMLRAELDRLISEGVK